MESSVLKHALFALALVGLVPDLLAAQASHAIPENARLRVTMASPPSVVIARYRGVTDSTLVLGRDSEEFALALREVVRLEQSSGHRLSIAGGLAGLVLGTVAGGAVGCAVNRDSYGAFCGGDADTKVIVGGALGGLAGAALGAWLFKRQTWEELPIAPFRRE